MFSLRDIVGIAVQVEQNGERTYRQAAAQVGDARLATLLTRLADEEAQHARWFAGLVERLGGVEVDVHLDGLANSMLRGIVQDETFSLADVDWTAAHTVEQVLSAATEHEADTVIFYQMIGSFVTDPAVLDQLEAIIEEEQRHGCRLEQYLAGEAAADSA